MPLIDEILDELNGAKFFTTMDFKSGFHQVRMNLVDELKTMFKTHHGHYQDYAPSVNKCSYYILVHHECHS
jgi:hypothetical protein